MVWTTEKRREYFRNRYRERRQYALESLGGKCVQCGSEDNLHLDHIDKKKKSRNIDQALLGWSFWRMKQEPLKCQLLCSRCHSNKHVIEDGKQVIRDINNNILVHGTLSSVRYCKCKICKKAKSDYSKEYHKLNG